MRKMFLLVFNGYNVGPVHVKDTDMGAFGEFHDTIYEEMCMISFGTKTT